MPNPFYNTHQSTNQQNSELKNLYQMCCNPSSSNAIQMMLNQNPQFGQIVAMMRNGMSYENIFKSICQSRGLDPNQTLAQIKNMIR